VSRDQEYAGTCLLVTFLKLFKALKGDFEFVGREERGRVLENLHSEKGDDRHGGERRGGVYGTTAFVL